MFIMNSKTGEVHDFWICDNGDNWTEDFLMQTWFEWNTDIPGYMISDDVDFLEILEDAMDHKYFFGGIFAAEIMVYFDNELIEDSTREAPERVKAKLIEALNTELNVEG